MYTSNWKSDENIFVITFTYFNITLVSLVHFEPFNFFVDLIALVVRSVTSTT